MVDSIAGAACSIVIEQMFAFVSISRPEGVCQSPNRTSVLDFASGKCNRRFVGHVSDVTYAVFVERLDFDNEGEDHGTAADFASGEVAKRILDLVLEH